MKTLHFSLACWRPALFVLLSSMLGACAQRPVAGLPGADALQEKRVLVQQTEARWQHFSGSLLTILQSGDGEIDFLATTLLGQEVFHLHYDGVKPVLLSRSDALPRNFRADYLLRDLLWAQWPADSLRPGLEKAGLELSESGSIREIHGPSKKGAQVLLVIQHSDSGSIHIENPSLRYTLDLSPADDETATDNSRSESGGPENGRAEKKAVMP